jgi:tetratricopeptide (TPR) repeat protein
MPLDDDAVLVQSDLPVADDPPLDDRELAAALTEAEVWGAERMVVPLPSPLHTFSRRAAEEEEQASAFCDEILAGPPTWWPQRLRNLPAARTAGVVRHLLERMRQLLERSPSHALQATTLAIEIANALDPAAYPNDYAVRLRAQAWRDHAFVLSFLGRTPEALQCAGRSRRLFEQVPLPEYDLARLSVVEASILRMVDRADEALELIRDAARTFVRFGDEKRAVETRMTEGAILHYRGALEEALKVWIDLQHHPALDALGELRLELNIANCHADLGHPELAAEVVRGCIEEFGMLGMETERTRSRWLLGHTLAASGRTNEAIPVLRQTWREFTALEMTADAGLTALDLAEALLVAGQPAQVPAICREVIAQFTEGGMVSPAITALSFLREAVAIGTATPSLVRHVHDFLRQLPAEQPRLYAPPPPGAAE